MVVLNLAVLSQVVYLCRNYLVKQLLHCRFYCILEIAKRRADVALSKNLRF